ncbi:MAG TPA: class I SAM-dependent methyltransferase [Flavobacteriaceae bacterium]|nr:class I SAM-dependent methyltransferase [Flavobacteriaceae bacterium]
MQTQKNTYLHLKDYAVTEEDFTLVYNSEFDMLETYPKLSELEMQKYYESDNYISHTDSNSGIVDKAYQVVKKITLHNKLKLINSLKTSEKEILDIGCGTGDFLLKCKNNNWSIYGVEPNAKAKQISISKLKNTSLFFENIEEINNIKFDVITMWHVLEHVPNLENYITTIKKLLKPNGVLIVAVPNYKSYDAQHYKNFWAAFDVPRHRWHFSKKSIQKLFVPNFKLVKIKPMWFDSFYISLLSEKYKTGSQNFIKAFFVGLWSNLNGIFTKEHSSHIYVLKSK